MVNNPTVAREFVQKKPHKTAVALLRGGAHILLRYVTLTRQRVRVSPSGGYPEQPRQNGLSGRISRSVWRPPQRRSKTKPKFLVST